MSAPAENASPVPVMITAFTASFTIILSSRDASCCSTSLVIALRASGLLKVIRAIPFSSRYRSGSFSYTFVPPFNAEITDQLVAPVLPKHELAIGLFRLRKIARSLGYARGAPSGPLHSTTLCNRVTDLAHRETVISTHQSRENAWARRWRALQPRAGLLSQKGCAVDLVDR